MVVWYCDADIAEDAYLTEGDINLARTPISTPPSAQVPVCDTTEGPHMDQSEDRPRPLLAAITT